MINYDKIETYKKYNYIYKSSVDEYDITLLIKSPIGEVVYNCVWTKRDRARMPKATDLIDQIIFEHRVITDRYTKK